MLIDTGLSLSEGDGRLSSEECCSVCPIERVSIMQSKHWTLLLILTAIFQRWPRPGATTREPCRLRRRRRESAQRNPSPARSRQRRSDLSVRRRRARGTVHRHAHDRRARQHARHRREPRHLERHQRARSCSPTTRQRRGRPCLGTVSGVGDSVREGLRRRERSRRRQTYTVDVTHPRDVRPREMAQGFWAVEAGFDAVQLLDRFERQIEPGSTQMIPASAR